MSLACQRASVFLACVAASGWVMDSMPIRMIYAQVMPDHICIGASQGISSHPCNCFTGEKFQHWDMCEAVTPQRTGSDDWGPTSGCMYGSETCMDVNGTAFSCGDVYACRIIRLSDNTDVTSQFEPACSTVIDQSTYDRVCNPTSKGSCGKTYGDCSPIQ